MDLNEDIRQTLLKEIARELLFSDFPEATENDLEEMLAMSENPFDAPILYALIKIAKEQGLK